MDLFWKNVLSSYLNLHKVVILYGNIYDNFPSQNNEKGETLHDIFEQKKLSALTNINTIQFSPEKPDTLFNKCKVEIKENEEYKPICRVFTNMSLAFHETREEWQSETWKKHEHLVNCINCSHPSDRFVIIFQDEGRIPGNFLANFPAKKQLYIPLPDYTERTAWVKQHQKILLDIIGKSEFIYP